MPEIAVKSWSALFGRNIQEKRSNYPEVRAIAGDEPDWALSVIAGKLSFILSRTSRNQTGE
ncbi:MAG: hypothetical protein IPI02_21580 [Sterolibacteriaceae bacterium]|nr:hypothetical protein [Sterolibacteriaceae bacterium]